MRNNKGITLVALVVTIIVLLILAGVSINLVIGENGIIQRSKDAVETYKKATVNEESILSGIENEIDEMMNESSNHIKKVPDGFIGIYNVEDFENMQPHQDYILMNDIDFNGQKIEPKYDIGTDKIFDGNYYKILNIYIDKTYLREEWAHVGIFNNNMGTLRNISQITGLIKTNTANMTGIVGYNCGIIENVRSSIVFDCIDTGHPVGGITSYSISSHNIAIIKKCIFDGEIKGVNIYAAGITGYIMNGAKIENCYDSGKLNGNSNYGICYYSNGTSTAIENCYDISKTDTGNEIICFYWGSPESITLNNLYTINKPTNVQETSLSNVLKLTIAQMKQQSSFVGFDFNNIWYMEPGGYPKLRNIPG